MPGSTYHPLKIESPDGETPEIEQFREAAKASPPRDELVALVGLDTGLRAGAIAHLSGEWLDRTGAETTIDVPRYQKCELGTGSSGRGGDTTGNGVPCSNCRERNTEDEWLPAQHKLPDNGDCWRPKSEAGYKGRAIPLKEDDTARAVETYFKVHDTVMERTSVARAVKRVADRAGLLEKSVDGNGNVNYWPTTHDLRDTFGTRLAIKGFSRDEIKSAMGHSSITLADDYVELSGRATASAFDKNW